MTHDHLYRAITTKTRPQHVASADWKAISLELQLFSPPEVKVTEKQTRKTVQRAGRSCPAFPIATRTSPYGADQITFPSWPNIMRDAAEVWCFSPLRSVFVSVEPT
jgi:hypothetical protein